MLRDAGFIEDGLEKSERYDLYKSTKDINFDDSEPLEKSAKSDLKKSGFRMNRVGQKPQDLRHELKFEMSASSDEDNTPNDLDSFDLEA